MANDRELLEKWSAGDLGAGSELFERHADRLYRFFASKVEDDVDDLMQKTLLACVESRERLGQVSNFRAYLFTIARHELYRYLQCRRKSREQLDYGVTSLKDLGITPRARLARNHDYFLLQQALGLLPLEQQVLLELYYWEEMKAPELSEVFALSIGAVHTRLSRARDALGKQVKELLGKAPQQFASIDDLDSWARSVREEAP